MSKKGHSNADNKNKGKNRDRAYFERPILEKLKKDRWQEKHVDPSEFGAPKNEEVKESKHEEQFIRPPDENE